MRWLLAKTITPQRFEPEIPSPAINYNQPPTRTLSAYARAFVERACLKELPFLMSLGLKRDSVLFDYGCGLGRLAFAASRYFDGTGQYIGYEPNARALAFLRNAYRNRDNFKFHGDRLPTEEDYIAVKFGQSEAPGKKAVDVRPQEFIGRTVDIQYSSSVLTHMWIDAIWKLLENLNQVVKPEGYCVNTWLIVDEFAEYSLRCGLADRILPYTVRGARTYSMENPLMCTAYDLDTVRDAYARTGQEIMQILWGSWSGRGNGVHYQDIVLSRPRPG